MDSVFSFVVPKERCVLESVVNGTNAGVGRSGSHYHFTEKEDGAPVPPLLVGSLLGDLTQRWETVGHACESQGICIWVTVRVANEQEMAWVSSIEGKEPVLLLDM